MLWASIYLQRVNLFSPFLLFSCLSLLKAIVNFILPYNTLGRELYIANEDEN